MEVIESRSIIIFVKSNQRNYEWRILSISAKANWLFPVVTVNLISFAELLNYI
jgi:hypothetical protein